MVKKRQLPAREHVFIHSLMYHGFRLTERSYSLKYNKGYVIPANYKEDARGIDVWVKMPKSRRIIPVQITQRGVSMFRKHCKAGGESIESFTKRSQERIQKKKRRCLKNKIAFALVGDFDGKKTNSRIAWGDIKALRYAIAHLKY